MFVVYFSCFTPKGDYRECIYGAGSIASCLTALNGLVSRGWKLVRVDLSDGHSARVSLPVAAFDGEPVEQAIAQLSVEWQTVLAQE